MRDFMLRLPYDLHKKLKIIAVTQGVTMTSFIIEAIQEKMKREN